MKKLLQLLSKLFFSTKVYALSNIDIKEPSIYMPNHVSFLDPFILYPFLPKKVVYVVNTDMAKKFYFFFRFINHVTVNPLNANSLKRVINLVKEGTSVVIFPEGRVSTTGNLMKIYNGISMIAAKTGAPIYPIIIFGAERSKFSRIKTSVNSQWFPNINIHISSKMTLDKELLEDFRRQKNETSSRILTFMQEAKYIALQKECKDTNLFNNLIKAEKIHGKSKTVVSDLSTKLSYKKGLLTSYVFGGKLQKILYNEDRVGVMLPNAVGHFVTLFSLFYAGKSVSIINFTSGISNILDCLEVSGIKTILTSKVFVEKGKFEDDIKKLSQEYRVLYLEDIKISLGLLDKLLGLLHYKLGKKAHKGKEENIVLYTSGSESKPKGVVLSHKNLISNVNQMASVLDFTHKDRMLNPLPMFHSFGLTAGTLLPVLKGIELMLYPTPLHYKVIPELVYTKNITMLLGTPSFLMGYGKNAHPFDFNTLRYVIAGGEKLRVDIRNLWMDKFGIRILEGYGTTETAPVLSVNTPLFYQFGSVGRFLPGIKWRLEGVEGIEKGGNLMVKGPNVMEGYLLPGKGFVKSEEWYNCGDIVSLDKEGYITIQARLKRFAKISGEMVSLDTVEQFASNCFPDAKFAAIVLSDSKKGEKIILCTTQEGVDKKILRESLLSHGYSMLEMPSEVILITELPLLGNGKIDYRTLSTIVKERGEE